MAKAKFSTSGIESDIMYILSDALGIKRVDLRKRLDARAGRVITDLEFEIALDMLGSRISVGHTFISLAR